MFDAKNFKACVIAAAQQHKNDKPIRIQKHQQNTV